MTRHRMPPVDAAWLHMDRATNLMVVTSVMWFDEPLDRAAVRALIRERLVDRFPRYTQRVVETATGVFWEDDEDFDLDRHVHHVTLPPPGDQAALERYVAWTQHKRLPRDRPLWEVYLIDGYHGHGSAVVWRMHHCIADGVALMRVMLSLTDDPAQAAEADLGAAPPTTGRGAALRHLAGSVAGGVVGDAVHPTRVVDLARTFTTGSRTLARLLALPPDHPTSLKGHAGRSKHVVWGDPIPLSAVKAAAHAGGVTVNDLLLAAVTGALRSYLAREDGHAPDIRAIVPYNLRPLDQPLPADLGNRFGLVFLSLPVSRDDPRERLAELRRRMETIKHSPEGVLTFEILDLIGHTPYGVEQVIVDVFAAKGTAVMTNVPGPTHAVYLAGRKVRGTIGWPPESGNIGLGVSIISYDGDVTLGLLTDARLVRDPRRMLDEMQQELRDLERLCHAGAATTARAAAT